MKTTISLLMAILMLSFAAAAQQSYGSYPSMPNQSTATNMITNGPVAETVSDSSALIGWSTRNPAETTNIRYGTDRAHMTSVLRAAAAHPGVSFVEIYQNCEIFNDGAFAMLGGPDGKSHWVNLTPGEPLRYGQDLRGAVIRDPDGAGFIAVDVGNGAAVVHDPTRVDPAYAFALSRIGDNPGEPTPFGVFRDVQAPTYEQLVTDQLSAQAPGTDADLEAVFAGKDSWTIT